MIKRALHVLNNENGSPMVETIVAISVALLVVIAIGGFGAVLIKWVSDSTGSIDTLGG